MSRSSGSVVCSATARDSRDSEPRLTYSQSKNESYEFSLLRFNYKEPYNFELNFETDSSS